jgi:hypothetical protein
MFSRFNRPVVARIAVTFALGAVGGAGMTVVMPALASGTRPVANHVHASPITRQTVMVAPLAWHGRLSAAATGKAVSTCAFYAAKAGWANNGYYAGDLVTAATICVAESGGDPHLIVCDGKNGITGQGDYPKFKCPEPATISYDRGLWQLNSVNDKAASDKCAFNPVCNASNAYLASVRGISFVPWTSYDQGTYAKQFLDLVQADVTKLSNGTVTSALLGECLAQGRHARVVVANCGSGAINQRWSITGGRLRSGSLCGAIASARGRARVVLSPCARRKTQRWSVSGRYELRNAADRKCLTDPGSSLTAGTQTDVTDCANAKNQTWWLP